MAAWRARGAARGSPRARVFASLRPRAMTAARGRRTPPPRTSGRLRFGCWARSRSGGLQGPGPSVASSSAP
eukprot:7742793-Lingulodinium_polyedra.AAC.1